MAYESLAALRDAYRSGELAQDERLVIDNDDVYLYASNGLIFEEHPAQVLREALDLLGIPWELP